MSQVTSYVTAGSPLTMAQLKTSLDAMFAAAASANRDSTAPSNPFEGMFWWDTSGGAVEILKRYTAAAGWVTLMSVNITTGAVSISSDTIDDASSNAAAMQTTVDPYPGASPSLPTTLTGELHRIRYLIAQITGKTYWYQDPDATLATLIPAGTKMWFYQNTAPAGWTIDATPADAVLAVKGGTQAFNANGGTQAGTWTQANHTHTTGDVTLSAAQSGLPAHTHDMTLRVSSTQYPDGWVGGVNAPAGGPIYTGAVTGGAQAASTAHNHGATGNGATANTWRPLAQLGIICTKD